MRKYLLAEGREMQTSLFVLVVLAMIPHAILAGAGIDRLVVAFPGWYRIGPVAFANYARATDLANGRLFYPLLGIGGPLLTWAALLVALAQHAPAGQPPPV
jgi:hypothetical protein